MTELTLSSGVEIRNPISVGQEFIAWAEQYWHIDKLMQIENPDTFAGEVCDYKYMRNIFVEKINSIIRDRIGLIR